MRKQPTFLEHIAEAATLRRPIDLLGGREQDLLVDRDPSAIWADQARERIDERSLAGAGAAEERCDAGRRRGEHRGKRERAEAFLDVDLYHAALPSRWASRRDSSSDARSAAKERATEITVRRIAAASPPGCWIRLKKARGSVWVRPGRLETKLIVAPNSPMLRAKARIAPASRPGAMSGNVTVKNTRTRPAPRVRAAASRRRSTASSE